MDQSMGTHGVSHLRDTREYAHGLILRNNYYSSFLSTRNARQWLFLFSQQRYHDVKKYINYQEFRICSPDGIWTFFQQLTSQLALLKPEEKHYHGIMFEKLCLRNALQMTNWNILPMCTMYPNHNITRISRFCKELKTLVYKWFSVKSRSQRSSAYWPSLRGDINTTGNAPYRVGNVQSFIRHQVTLLLIKWYEDHPRRDHFTSSIIVCGTLSFYVKC